MWRLATISVSILAATLVASGLQVTPQQETRETIAGTVTRADTKAPLPYVRIELVREDDVRLPTGHEKPCKPEPDNETSVTRQFVMSDASGRFTFTGIVPGSYYLFAEHEGFLESAYGQRGRFPIPTALRIGVPPSVESFGAIRSPNQRSSTYAIPIPLITTSPPRGGLGRDQQTAAGGAPSALRDGTLEQTGQRGGLGREAERIAAGADSAIGNSVAGNSRNLLQNLEIALTAAPAITGSVVEEGGAPLAAAVVQAYQFRYTPMNGRTLKSARTALTNDQGVYRLFWLDPARYVVAAGYSGYALQPWILGMNLTANLPSPDSGHPTTFYPASDTAENSIAVPVNPGSVPLADFHLRARSRFVIQIRLAAERRPSNPSLLLVPYGGDLCATPDYGIMVKSDGTFEIRDVPEGIYVAAVMSGRDYISDLTTIKVETGASRETSIPVVPPTEIRGNVYFDSVPQTVTLGIVRVNLTRTGQALRQFSTGVMDSMNGRFAIRGVGPGSYYPTVDLPPGFYVDNVVAAKFATNQEDCDDTVSSSAEYSYMDLHGHLDPQRTLRIPSVIPISAECLVIRVKFGGTLKGHVHDRVQKPAAGALVVAVPKSAWSKADDGGVTPADRFLVGTTDSSGDFVLAGTTPSIAPSKAKDVASAVAPEYHLYAFENADPNIIYDPAFSERFRGKELYEINIWVLDLQTNRWNQVTEKSTDTATASSCPGQAATTLMLCYLHAIPASETDEIQ